MLSGCLPVTATFGIDKPCKGPYIENDDLLVTLLDSDGLVTEAWQPRGLPATFLVDPGGTIRYQALGGREWEKPVYVDFLRGLSE